jgi:hypothetical protein
MLSGGQDFIFLKEESDHENSMQVGIRTRFILFFELLKINSGVF